MIDLRKQNFGIEIEMTRITREKAAEIIKDFFKSKLKREGDEEYLIKDNKNRTWKVVRDGSIKAEALEAPGERPALAYYKVELVSPICNYDDIETIQEIVRILEKNGAIVNKSCGIHIHIDGSNHNINSLINLSNMISAKEDLIYKALKVNKERKAKYCKMADKIYLEKLNRNKPKTIKKLKEYWYDNDDKSSEQYDSTRYRALNLHSMFHKGTVEFRYFNSTLHVEKIKAYIQLCLAMSAKAINQKRVSPIKKRQLSNEKFNFRVWLLSLGLIGDEFKITRAYLLKNLAGNSAWLTEGQAINQRERLVRERNSQNEISQENTNVMSM